MELRGHDHTVEVVVFAPVAAYAAIRELAGIPVCSSVVCLQSRRLTSRSLRAQNGQIDLPHTSQQAPETELSSFGIRKQDKCCALW